MRKVEFKWLFMITEGSVM